MTTRTCNWPGCTAPAAAQGPRRCKQHYGRAVPRPYRAKPPAPTGQWCTPCGRRVTSLIHAPGTTSEDQMSGIAWSAEERGDEAVCQYWQKRTAVESDWVHRDKPDAFEALKTRLFLTRGELAG
jgi:hypothetical protein